MNFNFHFVASSTLFLHNQYIYVLANVTGLLLRWAFFSQNPFSNINNTNKICRCSQITNEIPSNTHSYYDVQRKNVVNNVNMSSLRAPWPNDKIHVYTFVDVILFICNPFFSTYHVTGVTYPKCDSSHIPATFADVTPIKRISPYRLYHDTMYVALM